MTVTNRLNGDVPVLAAEEAANHVDDTATVLMSGFGSVGYPKAVPQVLSSADRDLGLAVVSAGSVGEEIDESLVESGAIRRRLIYQARPRMRQAINDREIPFHDGRVFSLGDEVQYGNHVDADIAIVEAIAAGEDWFIPSMAVGHTPAFVGTADRVLVEVNSAQPLELQSIHDIYRPGPPPGRDPIPLDHAGGRIGDPKIRFDAGKLLGVVETDRPDSPYSFRSPTTVDKRIASNLGDFLLDEVERTAVFDEQVHLQFGVGSLGNALMGELSERDFGDRTLVYFGEVIQDGLLEMIADGKLEAASATSLALSKTGQQTMFDNANKYTDNIVLRPADISNHPALINRFGVIAVNSALEVDIFGNANSSHVKGRKLINGIGGSCDYNGNALLSICALPSLRANGSESRVVPMTLHVDQSEHQIDVIITEHGVADLRGRSPVERARRIIDNCADPSCRQQLHDLLERGCREGGHIPLDTERALSWMD